MTQTRLFHDFEWFSELDVTVNGVSKTARHPSTTALMCAYKFDDGPVEQWVPEEGQPMPADLRDAMRDPDVILQSWNKPAEWCTWTHVLGMPTPHSRWRDTMVLALSLSLPGKLAKVPPILRLPFDQQKDRRGKVLINTFSKLNKTTKARPYARRSYYTDPELWEEFKEYNRQDVVAEYAVWRKLRKYDMPQHEWDLFALDQEINEAGMPIRMPVVDNALEITTAVVDRRMHELRDITGLANPNSGAQLLPWLQSQGYRFNDLKKGHVKRAMEAAEDGCRDKLDEIESQDYRRALTLRAEVSRSSSKKYVALKKSVDDDWMLRYTLQFAAAGRTWRWGGRKYQPQNLSKPADWLEKTQAEAVRDLELLDPWCIEQLYSRDGFHRKDRRSPMDLLATCVRPVLQAPDGFMLFDADLNAIENRVLGWLARDPKILRVFEEKRDPYVDFATYMFGEPYEKLFAEYKAGDKTKRTTAKPGVLGCGYMLSAGNQYEDETTGEIEATGLLGYAWNMDVKLTPEQSALSVKVWRQTFREAVNFWYAIEKAAKRCIRTHRPQEVDRIRFEWDKPWLKMVLPSGRSLRYLRPKLEDKVKPWGEIGETITYESLNDKNQWVRVDTHPGKLTENADQAIARDVLAHGLVLAKKRKLDIRLHVHDQAIGLAREDVAEKHLAILRECMSERPWWAPDLPLDSAGFVSKIMVKD